MSLHESRYYISRNKEIFLLNYMDDNILHHLIKKYLSLVIIYELVLIVTRIIPSLHCI